MTLKQARMSRERRLLRRLAYRHTYEERREPMRPGYLIDGRGWTLRRMDTPTQEFVRVTWKPLKPSRWQRFVRWLRRDNGWEAMVRDLRFEVVE